MRICSSRGARSISALPIPLLNTKSIGHPTFKSMKSTCNIQYLRATWGLLYLRRRPANDCYFFSEKKETQNCKLKHQVMGLFPGRECISWVGRLLITVLIRVDPYDVSKNKTKICRAIYFTSGHSELMSSATFAVLTILFPQICTPNISSEGCLFSKAHSLSWPLQYEGLYFITLHFTIED